MADSAAQTKVDLSLDEIIRRGKNKTGNRRMNRGGFRGQAAPVRGGSRGMPTATNSQRNSRLPGRDRQSRPVLRGGYQSSRGTPAQPRRNNHGKPTAVLNTSKENAASRSTNVLSVNQPLRSSFQANRLGVSIRQRAFGRSLGRVIPQAGPTTPLQARRPVSSAFDARQRLNSLASRTPQRITRVDARRPQNRPLVSVTQLSPGVARSAPGVARYTPGVARSAPGIARSAPGVVRSAPGVARYTPGVARYTPGVVRSAPGIARSTSGNIFRSRPHTLAQRQSPFVSRQSRKELLQGYRQVDHVRQSAMSSPVASASSYYRPRTFGEPMSSYRSSNRQYAFRSGSGMGSSDNLVQRYEHSVRDDSYSSHQALRKITVSNLHPDVSSQDIEELFSSIGPLRSSRLLYPGYAEVVFFRAEDAIAAFQRYHDRNLDGQPMICKLVAEEKRLGDSSQAGPWGRLNY